MDVSTDRGTRLRSGVVWCCVTWTWGKDVGTGGVEGALNVRGDTSSSEDVDDEDWLVKGDRSR